MPLRQELIAATVPLPLPHFSWKEAATTSTIACENGLGALPPPPTNDRRNSLRRNSQQQQHQQQLEQLQDTSDVPSTDSEVEQNESSCGGDFDKLANAEAVGVVSSSSSRETVRIAYLLSYLIYLKYEYQIYLITASTWLTGSVEHK